MSGPGTQSSGSLIERALLWAASHSLAGILTFFLPLWTRSGCGVGLPPHRQVTDVFLVRQVGSFP